MTTAAVAFMNIGTILGIAFFGMHNVDIFKKGLKLIAAAFYAFNQLVVPVAHFCHNIKLFSAFFTF